MRVIRGVNVQKCGKRLCRWGLLIFYTVLLVWAVNQYGIALSVVNGTSMQPTLHDGDRLLINKFKFLYTTPSLGDVITFRDPSDTKRLLVKRVVGLPGDVIEIKAGKLYRNGAVVQEKYVDSIIEDGDFGPIAVKENTVFVLGDNRQRHASRDSRYASVGLVPFGLIDGKVELILWRPSVAAFLQRF